MQIRTYNDKEGVKKWVTEIIVEGFDFPPKDSGSGSGNTNTSTSSFGHEANFNLDDDIPF
ncbi:Single-stranded DNA-binding protein (fragment) [Candidatus Desulfosporosinus infrequens]|uniref:Single-stranded DNA-binding protein n=1 Tax=Candidatus Desulfosporosinus infrequens TaxID=2043169 RepID=A0A2U3L6N0_9FIRM